MVDRVETVLCASGIAVEFTEALLPAQLRRMDVCVAHEEALGGVGRPLEVPFGIDLDVVTAAHARFPAQVLSHPRGGTCLAWELLHPSAPPPPGQHSSQHTVSLVLLVLSSQL